MEIKINIPNEASETIEKGLHGFARRLNPKYRTDKKGKEFFEEFFTQLIQVGFEAADPEVIEAKKKLRDQANAMNESVKERFKKLK